MSFDKTTRNRLAKFVADFRRLITDEFTEKFQSLYGISVRGDVAALEKLTHLDEAGLATAALLRERINYLVKTHPDDKDGTKGAVERLAREQAFTVLNRLAAIRMAEKRGLIVESVGRGYQSKGFKVFETVAGSALGDAYHRYRRYLFCLFDELSIDLGILFDRHSPQGLLFPREPALLSLLDLLNATDLERLWAEDETIGWIYQYYNDPAERKKMRDESAAPRNSRELAVRNQFFTPRYVVEFLTDNTLGRIWYEMTKGQTRLADQCRYMVRRPPEIFLKEGDALPAGSDNSESKIQNPKSQEELQQQPVYIPHRPFKDPREIRLLDPACGSMHFGLYAFDLFETIYVEAWDLAETHPELRTLTSDFSTKEEFMRQVPRLIIEHNIHGIDIDPRAVQIAGLSLWLRAQKAWQKQNVPAADRPRVRRSNLVCAEPMPGSLEMLENFVATLDPPQLGELMRTVFERMQIAGEAGSLLKIEEEIRTAVETARKGWNQRQEKPELFSTEDLNWTTKSASRQRSHLRPLAADFWQTAESRLLDALRDYAEQTNADSYQRRLFADDAAHGFAFIDLCRKRYDAVVMNPPFGELASAASDYIAQNFEMFSKNILCAFIERYSMSLADGGRAGSVLDRTVLIKNSYEAFRRKLLLENGALAIVGDLGWGVLDANVEVSSFVLGKQSVGTAMATGYDVTNATDKAGDLLAQLQNPIELSHDSLGDQPFAAINFQMPFYLRQSLRTFANIGVTGAAFYNGHTIKSDVFKRLVWEVDPHGLGESVKWMWNGSEYSPFYVPFQECVIVAGYAGGLAGHRSTIFRNPSKHGLPGLCFGKRGDFLDVQVMPSGFVLTNEGFGGPASDSKRTWFILALLNSLPAQCALNFYCGQHKGVGYVNALPVPKTSSEHQDRVVGMAQQVYNICRVTNRTLETDPGFLCMSQVDAESREQTSESWINAYRMAGKTVHRLLAEIDNAFLEAFEVDDVERKALSESSTRRPTVSAICDLNHEDGVAVNSFWARALLSHATGVAFGRWDIRYSTGEQAAPELPDPFAPLPVCPPGMLKNAEGLPAEPKDVPTDYPMRISWPGILVDDENDPEDIVARVEVAMKVIWKDQWEAIEQEACKILSVETLREYFGKPAKFFADHLKRYSKSRRQAPIYWPLSTKSSSYTLWLYYHRLSDQTLHTCLADFLDPKIRKLQTELDAAQAGGSTRAAELREFLDELKDLHDEIERIIKLPWKPNLNDGVLITASPLWKLFRLPKWQKDLKVCCEKLSKGDFDWAHLAHSIWPQRVGKACEKDRSIAIAHNLEHLCKIEPPKPKKKSAKAKSTEEEEDEPELIE